MATKSPPAFPLYGDLSEKKMRALGEKLDKLQDPNGFKHYDLLGKHTDGPNPPLLWHLVRCGLVARDVQSAGLYSRLGEYIPADVTAADVITVLRHVPEDMGVLDRGKARDYFMLTPGILSSIDEMLVHAYVDDAAALRAAAAELPRSLQVAIDCVRRRAGEVIDPEHAREIHEHLARRHCADGLALNIDVPRIVDGAAVVSRLADDTKVCELADLFGTRAAWAALQLGWVRSHVAEFRSQPDYVSQRTSDGLATASLRDLIYLFGDGYWKHSSLLTVLDRRTEAPSVLLATAAEILASGLAPFRIDAAQVKPTPAPRGGSGEDDDEDDGDADYDGGDGDDEFGGDYDSGGSDDGEAEVEEEPDAGPESDRVRALAEALTLLAIERLHAQGAEIPASCDAAFDLERVFDSDPAYIVRLRAGLALLGPVRAHAVIRRVLAKQFWYGKATAIADVCHDPAVVEEVLARLAGEGAYVDADMLGFCGPQVVPAIAAHAAAIQDETKRGKYRESINYILARAAAAGQSWEPSLAAQIDLGAIQYSYGGSKVSSVLALLDGLPLPRYEAVVRANLERGVEPVPVVRALRPDASDELLDLVFTALLRQSGKISSGALGDRLRVLGSRVVGPLRRAFGDTPTQATLMRELERALDGDAFVAFKATLDRPIETREQELRRLCAGLPGPKVTIYRLSRAERAPAADEVGRIGGAPRGVADGDVPRYGDEVMEHVITLDLARLPGLGRAGKRSLSLYLPDPGHGEKHERGVLVWRTEAELAAAPGSVADAVAIEVEAFEVPAAIFAGRGEGDVNKVRGMVYSSHGYALGGPLWLQDGDEGLDAGFLFQFDEGLCHINLGDCGVMYVFDGDISWQCH
jgi:hypothetical protein